MITRIMVIDPNPRDPKDDTIVYQVPERSRAYELLLDMLTQAGLSWVEVPSERLREKKL